MNRPEPAFGDYIVEGRELFEDQFLADDEVPATLVAALRQLAIDFVPETLAACELINRWLETQSDLAAGTPIERGVGLAEFEVEGTP